MIKLLPLYLCFIFLASSVLANTEGYYRYPALSNNNLIFTAEGDLWKVSADGGVASRLTTHEGFEYQSFISPDGSQVAFIAAYDAEPAIYVMPVEGGMPKRLTFENNGIRVRGWTKDGQIIYSRGPRYAREAFTLAPETLKTEKIPLADANQLSFDDKGKYLFFTRFGLELTGDHAKHYKGGAIAQLWRFKLGSDKEAKRLIKDFKADLTTPMWWDDRLYFVSNKNGGANIWSVNAEGKNLKQHTESNSWDIRNAQLDNGRITYQSGADIYIYTISSNQSKIVKISLQTDQDASRVRTIHEPLEYLTSANFGAKGDTVAVTARGKVVLARVGKKRRIEFDIATQYRSRFAVPGADGKFVYLISDISGENEIWRFAADGSGEGEQLTSDSTFHRWKLYLSPDGKYLAHDNKRGELWLMDLKTKENKMIYEDENGSDDVYSDFNWSSDGLTLAFTYNGNHESVYQILLHDITKNKTIKLTTEKYEAYAPAFSEDGKWLYFLSDRYFRPTPGHPWGDRNTGVSYDKRTKAYAYALQSGNRFPYYKDDELMDIEDSEAKNGKDKKDKDKKGSKENKENKDSNENDKNEDKKPEIEWSGLSSRLYELPLKSGNYSALKADSKRLYLLSHSISENSKPSLKTYAISSDNPKLKKVLSSVNSFTLSADGEKLFYRTTDEDNAGLYIVEASNDIESKSKNKLRLRDWRLTIVPREEWRQIFIDAWRMHRDFSFDPTMRGLNWKKIKDKYLPLVDRLTHRIELDDLLGEMNAELDILHSQVRSRDHPSDDERAVTPSLAAELSQVKDGLRIDYIYKTDIDFPSYSGPLNRPGLDVVEGDIITAINGHEVTNLQDLVIEMNNQSGQQVLLDIKRGKDSKHKIIVRPSRANSNRNFRRQDWVERNKATVKRQSKNRFGYFHLSAMGSRDLATFTREYYANALKDGLIIDVRGNGGGNVDSLMIEKLLRQTWSFWKFGDKDSYGNMQQTFRGHIVVLIDQATYSDGETFAAGIKALGIAPLIGKQTAGAGIWLSGRNSLSDNGMARIAEFGQYRLDGKWMLEGWGVEPDISVENTPHETFKGEDKQLATAIKQLKKMLKKNPIPKMKAKPISAVGTPAVDVN